MFIIQQDSWAHWNAIALEDKKIKEKEKMKSWSTPSIEYCKAEELKQIIKARAWSVGGVYSVGEFLNTANQGMSGTVYMDGNPGHTVQVTVIGWFIVLGIEVKELMLSTGEIYRYRKIAGIWVRE